MVVPHHTNYARTPMTENNCLTTGHALPPSTEIPSLFPARNAAVNEHVTMSATRAQQDQLLVNKFVELHLKDTSTVAFPWNNFFQCDNGQYSAKVVKFLQSSQITPKIVGAMDWNAVVQLISGIDSGSGDFNDTVVVVSQLISNSQKFVEFCKQTSKASASYDPNSVEFKKKISSYKDCPKLRLTKENMIFDITLMFAYFAKHGVAPSERVPLIALNSPAEAATKLMEMFNQVDTSSLSDEELLKLLPSRLMSAITIDMHLEFYLCLDATKLNVTQEMYILLHSSYSALFGLDVERQKSNYIRSLPDDARRFASHYSEAQIGLSFHDLADRVHKINTDCGHTTFFGQQKTNVMSTSHERSEKDDKVFRKHRKYQCDNFVRYKPAHVQNSYGYQFEDNRHGKQQKMRDGTWTPNRGSDNHYDHRPRQEHSGFK
jgi:hypothetical protein